MIKIANNLKSMLAKQAAAEAAKVVNHAKTKQALNVGDALDFTTGNQALDYGIAGGGGALLGGGVGALINKLRGGSALKGGLIGAGIGGAAGLGAKAVGDEVLDSARRVDAHHDRTIRRYENDLKQLRADHPYQTGDGLFVLRPPKAPITAGHLEHKLRHAPETLAFYKTLEKHVNGLPAIIEDDLLRSINEERYNKNVERKQDLMPFLWNQLGPTAWM